MMAVHSSDRFDADLERSFIHACLRAYLYRDSSLLIPAPNLDWDKFYALLIQDKLVGLFSILGRTFPDLWPRAIKEKLREDRYRQIPYLYWCLYQVETVLTSLHDLSIPVIVLKGWAYVPLVYDGDPSQRPSSDIDLLVKPQDVQKVTDILYNLNYRNGDLEPWPGYFRRYSYSEHFLSTQMYPNSSLSFNIDLHWGFPDSPYYNRRKSVQTLFGRAQPLKVAGSDVYCLATEDNLIYASVHMAHHGYRDSLSRYYEIAALLLKFMPTINWEMIMADASTWRVILPLQRMFTKISNLWPGIIKADVYEDMTKLKPSWGERIIDRCLANSTRKEAMIIILSCLNTPGLIWRLRFTLETAFPGPTYLRHYFGPAPGNFWPLLYFRRFYRFLTG
jgi:hypothetical protein